MREDLKREIARTEAAVRGALRPRPNYESPAELARVLSGGRWEMAPHLALLSSWLVDLEAGKRSRIVVSMPVRHGKSTLTSTWLPLWYLARHPERRVVVASYTGELAAGWGRRVRNLVEEHGEHLGLRLSSDSTAADRWDLVTGGGMVCVGIGGALTGRGADLMLVDDPVRDGAEAESPTIRSAVWEWWTTTARTRLEPGGVCAVVASRWHSGDLSGALLEASADGSGETWDELNLPALAEDDDPLGREPGAPLWAARYDADALESARRALGSRRFAALYQGRPSPAEGGLLKREWFKRRWTRADLPDFDSLLISVDCSYEVSALRRLGTERKERTSDYAVMQVWGRHKADRYFLDQTRARLDFPATCQAIRDLRAKWPAARTVIVEAAANGHAVIATLQREFSGVIPVKPQGSKVARATAAAPTLESLNVLLPASAPWVEDFIEEAASFPAGKHDDQVDAMVHAINRFNQRPPARLFSWRV